MSPNHAIALLLKLNQNHYSMCVIYHWLLQIITKAFNEDSSATEVHFIFVHYSSLADIK